MVIWLFAIVVMKGVLVTRVELVAARLTARVEKFAVTLKLPATPFAVKTGAVATPFVPVFTVTTETLPGKVPPAPNPPGAVKMMGRFVTGLLATSRAVTAKSVAKAVLTVPLYPAADGVRLEMIKAEAVAL